MQTGILAVILLTVIMMIMMMMNGYEYVLENRTECGENLKKLEGNLI